MGECCSSLHSESLVLVPVSLPSDESKRLVDASKFLESFLIGIDNGFDLSIGGRVFSSLKEIDEKCLRRDEKLVSSNGRSSSAVIIVHPTQPPQC